MKDKNHKLIFRWYERHVFKGCCLSSYFFCAYWKAVTSLGDDSNEYHTLYGPVFPHEILALILMQRLR